MGFFAPEPRYLAGGAIGEFKTMVKRFHNAGIEVILDVVYNHTAEGTHTGPTSLRGIDNATYYRLRTDNPRFYVDDTGCGNTIDMSHARVLQLVTDSLRYWVEQMHVDGFRFDLATTLGRGQRLRQRRFLRRHPTGRGAGRGQADRRAMGSRTRRLPGRQLPAEVGSS